MGLSNFFILNLASTTAVTKLKNSNFFHNLSQCKAFLKKIYAGDLLGYRGG